jgi:penicillin-binding protein 1C
MAKLPLNFPSTVLRKWRIALAVLLVLAITPMAAFRLAIAFVPYPFADDQPIIPATWIVDAHGKPLAAFASLEGQWCQPLGVDQISPHLLDAIVATEDCRFYDHAGVDWRAVAAAAFHDVLSPSGRRGASTITMQLFRLRQPADHSLAAKVMQAIHATQLDRQLTKQQILVEYVNRAPFGGNLVGAAAASWRFFGRPCRDLSLGQAALLAGIPQSPRSLRPDRFPERSRVRRDHVLDRMLALGIISPAEKTLAENEPIDASWQPLPQCDAAASPGLLPMLTRLAQRNPGQTIATAIDPPTQKIANDLAEKTLATYRSSHIDAVAAVVLDTATGQCIADVSLTIGKTHGSNIDLTDRPRSTGSTLKPFIYAAAFDAGICTPSTILQDTATTWAGYQPADYDHDFAGPLPAAEALAQSRNIPALQLLSKVTVPRAIDVMDSLGLHTLAHANKPYGLPLAIGGADATPTELAQAYAALARQAAEERNGDATSFHVADKLVAFPFFSSAGRDLTVLRPAAAMAALNCLADPDRTAHVCPSAVALSPAWKTGTSSGHRDAWCAAVTPTRTVVVWLGNLDGSGSDRLVGADAAAPLALHILASCAPASDRPFLPPPDFVSAPIAASVELAAPTEQLVLLSPTPNQEILFDPSISANGQQVSFRARVAGDSSEPIYWFIDGKNIGRSNSTQPLLWSPAPGRHEIRAVSEMGQSVAAAIRVR